MKRAIFAIVGTVAGLAALLGFKTHPSTPTAAAVPPTTAGDDGAGSSSPPTTGANGGTNGGTKGKTAKVRTRTVTGDTISTRWGPVQLRLTLRGGRIIKVTTLQLPHGNERDREIDGSAVPQLIQETLAKQNANIDAISGASYTSAGYTRSLQSALDRARG